MGRVTSPRRRTFTGAFFAAGFAVLVALGLNAYGGASPAILASTSERIAAERPEITVEVTTAEASRLRIASTPTRVANDLLPVGMAVVVALLFALFAVLTRNERVTQLRDVRRASPRGPPALVLARR